MKLNPNTVSRVKGWGKKEFIRVLMLIVVAVLAGCAPTQQARDVTFSGYLDDYSILSRGKKGEALYLYINPEADWQSYNKVLLEPPEVWVQQKPGKDSQQKDYQHAINNFYSTLFMELERDYEMAREPGPKAMRFQIALTNVKQSKASAEKVNPLTPFLVVISGGKKVVTGKPAFTGEMSIEYKITDSESGALLAAGVDRKVGGKLFKGEADSWSDVDMIIRRWSKIARYRLCELRGEKVCNKPSW